MAAAVEAALPADAAVLVAAVADWRVERSASKLKKGGRPAGARLVGQSRHTGRARDSPRRPGLLVGFAAETDDVLATASAKRERKGCDWIIANDVSGDVMGGDMNHVHLIDADGAEDWERASKTEVARRLAERIAERLGGST